MHSLGVLCEGMGRHFCHTSSKCRPSQRILRRNLYFGSKKSA